GGGRNSPHKRYSKASTQKPFVDHEEFGVFFDDEKDFVNPYRASTPKHNSHSTSAPRITYQPPERHRPSTSFPQSRFPSSYSTFANSQRTSERFQYPTTPYIQVTTPNPYTTNNQQTKPKPERIPPHVEYFDPQPQPRPRQHERRPPVIESYAPVPHIRPKQEHRRPRVEYFEPEQQPPLSGHSHTHSEDDRVPYVESFDPSPQPRPRVEKKPKVIEDFESTIIQPKSKQETPAHKIDSYDPVVLKPLPPSQLQPLPQPPSYRESYKPQPAQKPKPKQETHHTADNPYFEETPTPENPRRARPSNKRVNIKQDSRPKKTLASRPPNVYETPVPFSEAIKCDNKVCLLPDCKCGNSEIPGKLPVKDVPQILMITFDDAINDINIDIYEELFNTGRKNPNGCPILGTFYVSHEWTDYGQVQTLYSKGHEMASHGITHSFGEKFSTNQWLKEINGQREILHLYGGVNLEDIRGMRAPFLQIGGNKMFEMLYNANFTYDSSMPVFDNKPPFWPYTLDYAINHECMISPC
ncbi:hypothetical protein B4U79_10914, partial [Dinothrombium tinctorium]